MIFVKEEGMKADSRQQGATLTSTIFVVLIAGFALSTAFKIGPHYLDNRIIAGAIKQVGQSGIKDKSSAEIRRKIADFFTINNVRDVNASQIQITRDRQGVRISLDYEKRIEMFGNVDVVLKFTNHYDSAEQTN